jgi:divalent metal cation (Fe/Co/Zn/Cd) transporter
MSQQVVQLSSAARLALVKRGRKLEYFTIAYNCLEGMIAIIAGLIAGSIALVGFGFDSVIEVTSGAALLWRLHADADLHRRERVEGIVLRIVGICFLLLGAYMALDSIKTLISHEKPEHSTVGIIVAAASLIIMPLLTRAKRRVARSINSNSLAADAKQTELCAYLSGIMLGGLALNTLLGWWWADPIAALVMVPIIIKEGIEALRGKPCPCGD